MWNSNESLSFLANDHGLEHVRHDPSSDTDSCEKLVPECSLVCKCLLNKNFLGDKLDLLALKECGGDFGLCRRDLKDK